MAFTTLENILTQKRNNPLAWFTYGKFSLQVGQCTDAVQAFTETLSYDAKYKNQITQIMLEYIKLWLRQSHDYMESGKKIKAVSDANTLIKGLNNFVPEEQRGSYGKEVAKIVAEEIKYSLQNNDLALADSLVAICPRWKDNEKVKNFIYNLFMDYGDKEDDRNCLPYYAWLSSLKMENPGNKPAATRLWKIGKQMESEYIDKDFDIFIRAEEYKKIARQWDPSYPPESKIYSYGKHQIELNTKEVLDYWIELKLNKGGSYNFNTVYGGQYMIIYNDGKIVKTGVDKELPSGQEIKFKLMPLEQKTKTVLEVLN